MNYPLRDCYRLLLANSLDRVLTRSQGTPCPRDQPGRDKGRPEFVDDAPRSLAFASLFREPTASSICLYRGESLQAAPDDRARLLLPISADLYGKHK